MGAAVARATGSMPSDLPQPPGLIVAGAGALAVLIILFRIVIPGDGPAGDLGGLVDLDATRKIGAFLGLIAAGGIAFGGWTAMNERASGQAPSGRGSHPGRLRRSRRCPAASRVAADRQCGGWDSNPHALSDSGV